MRNLVYCCVGSMLVAVRDVVYSLVSKITPWGVRISNHAI